MSAKAVFCREKLLAKKGLVCLLSIKVVFTITSGALNGRASRFSDVPVYVGSFFLLEPLNSGPFSRVKKEFVLEEQ